MFAKQLRSLLFSPSEHSTKQAAQHATLDDVGAVELIQPLLDPTEQGIRHIRLTGNTASQQLDGLFHMIHRMDMELAGFDGCNHLIGQVELLGIGAGQQDPLFAGETVILHTRKKPSIFSLTPPTACTLPN